MYLFEFIKDQVKFLMKSYDAPKPSSLLNKITPPCKLCKGPHETYNCMELPKQAFKEFMSSQVNKTGDKRTITNYELENSGDRYEAWKDKPNFSWNQTRSVSFNDSPPLIWSAQYPHQDTPKQQNQAESLQKFILSLETQLSQLENEFRQQQIDTNNKIDNLLKAIEGRIAERSSHEAKSVAAIHQTPLPVKIKSPSKLSNTYRQTEVRLGIIQHPQNHSTL